MKNNLKSILIIMMILTVIASCGNPMSSDNNDTTQQGTNDSGTNDSGTNDSGTNDSGTNDSGTEELTPAEQEKQRLIGIYSIFNTALQKLYTNINNNSSLSTDTTLIKEYDYNPDSSIDYFRRETDNGNSINIISTYTFQNYVYGDYNISGSTYVNFIKHKADDSISDEFVTGLLNITINSEPYSISLHIPTDITINEVNILCSEL